MFAQALTGDEGLNDREAALWDGNGIHCAHACFKQRRLLQQRYSVPPAGCFPEQHAQRACKHSDRIGYAPRRCQLLQRNIRYCCNTIGRCSQYILCLNQRSCSLLHRCCDCLEARFLRGRCFLRV